jgi:hypothetical protein
VLRHLKKINYEGFQMITQRLALLVISPIVLAIAACGTDDAPVVTTTLTGQVVKGPVGGATVCAYAVNGGVKSTSTVVPCVTSDLATGNYSLGNISYTGDMIIEATGGSYKDEVTGATVTLSTTLKTMVVAQGGATTGMITPLTTIALSTTPNLTSTAFGQAAANVASQAGLAGTNILTTAPTYAANGTTATNAYAAMLGAFAQYQKTSGGTLAATLAAWTSPANQATFQAALNAYASAASVLAANLPSVLNFAATGTPYSFGVSSNGVTAASGLVGSGSFTLSGAAGAGFAPLVGQGFTVGSLQSVTFTALAGTKVQILSVSIDGTGSTSSTTVSYTEGEAAPLPTSKESQWTFKCKGAACSGQVAIDTAGKAVTLTNITLAAEAGTNATGTILANGSGKF